MKVSELIEKLRKVVQLEGDIEVTFRSDMDYWQKPIKGTASVDAKRHYDSFVPVRDLKKKGAWGSMFEQPYQNELMKSPSVRIFKIW